MKNITLAIETSSNSCSVAIVKERKIVSSIYIENGFRQIENLIPLIENAIQSTNIGLDEIQKIGISVGPGMFTGIRIGLSCAKALSISLGIESLGVNIFDSIFNYFSYEKNVFVVLESKRDDLYTCFYDKNTGKKTNKNLEVNEINNRIKNLKNTYIVSNCWKKIKKVNDDNIFFVEDFVIDATLIGLFVNDEIKNGKEKNNSLKPIYR